jgi:hypothetical protein
VRVELTTSAARTLRAKSHKDISRKARKEWEGGSSLCVGLFLAPALSFIQMMTTWDLAKPAFVQFPSLRRAVEFENLGFVVLLIYGFIVGCTLMRGSPFGRTIVKQYLLIRLLGYVGIELIVLMMINDLPVTATSGIGVIAVGRAVIFEGVYFLTWAPPTTRKTMQRGI